MINPSANIGISSSKTLSGITLPGRRYENWEGSIHFRKYFVDVGFARKVIQFDLEPTNTYGIVESLPVRAIISNVDGEIRVKRIGGNRKRVPLILRDGGTLQKSHGPALYWKGTWRWISRRHQL
jgi:hypothetical protein